MRDEGDFSLLTGQGRIKEWLGWDSRRALCSSPNLRRQGLVNAGDDRERIAASQQYVAIAVHYDARTLPQLAAHFYRQAVEERNHAMMIVQYLLDADADVHVPGVPEQQTTLRGRPGADRARARAGEDLTRADRSARADRP